MGTNPVITEPVAAAIGPNHPLCRGDFPAIVFCGSVRELGDLPGEPTAHALHKYVLSDPRLNADDDFASSAGGSLRRWPQERIGPTDGVCFVFTDIENAHVETLQLQGAVEGEHFMVIATSKVSSSSDDLDERLGRFLDSVPDDGRIVILGYGQQGSTIAHRLTTRFSRLSNQIAVSDGNPDSQARATADGFAVIDASRALKEASAVIYSPLMRYDRLFSVFSEAEAQGLPVLDNARRSSGLSQFTRRGPLMLDAAAERVLAVQNQSVRLKPHGLSYNLHIIREDVRTLNGVKLTHLHGGYVHSLHGADEVIELGRQATNDQLASSTLVSSRHAYLSVRPRADLGFFAAREVCKRFWPRAMREVFPADHVIDLGSTAFERMLQGHLDAREVGSTMQTPAQRVTLGIAAAHYASNRPIIEIGSAFGGSAALVAAATAKGRPPIYSIDPETSTRDIMRFAFQREGQLDRLHQLIMTSDAAIGQLGHLHGKGGLVFIDGLHTHAGVEADFVNYAPLAAVGGALVFHDVCPAIHSVFRLVIERVLPDRRFEIKCLVDGLAVFERVA
jgi:predicted O-methyltransferase YrrM